MFTSLAHDTPALRSSLEPFGCERFEHLMRRITVELTRPGKSTARGRLAGAAPAIDVGTIGCRAQPTVARRASAAGRDGSRRRWPHLGEMSE